MRHNPNKWCRRTFSDWHYSPCTFDLPLDLLYSFFIRLKRRPSIPKLVHTHIYLILSGLFTFFLHLQSAQSRTHSVFIFSFEHSHSLSMLNLERKLVSLSHGTKLSYTFHCVELKSNSLFRFGHYLFKIAPIVSRVIACLTFFPTIPTYEREPRQKLRITIMYYLI